MWIMWKNQDRSTKLVNLIITLLKQNYVDKSDKKGCPVLSIRCQDKTGEAFLPDKMA